MPGVGRKIRVGVAAAVALLVSAYPVYAATTVPQPTLEFAASPAIIITEFQTNGGSAAQEFIELYNNTDEEIVFGDTAAQNGTGAGQWKLQFFNSAAAKSGTPVWTTTTSTSNSIALTGTIAAHEYFLVASTDYLPAGVQPDMVYAAASSHLMTDTGGALQLLEIDGTTTHVTAHDRVMWLAQSSATVLPQGVHASPGAGKSLQRIPNDDNEYLGSDGILAVFGLADDITPLAAWTAPVVEMPEPGQGAEGEMPSEAAAGEQEEPTPVAPVSNEGLLPPSITELLPNPASPLTDADDEFIELYNPNSSAFDLDGYQLQVGTTTLRTYTFPAGTIVPPLSYQAFYSAETGLSLANSGGQARLKSQGGLILSETDTYTTADDNEAWTFADGTWQWSSSATPGLENIIAVPVVAAKTARQTAAKSTKTTAAKKSTTKAAAKPKVTKTKAVKTKTAKKKPAAKTAATVKPEKPKPPIHTGILVAVVSVAVLYGLYEYRHDIALKFRQFGRNRKTGITDRLATAGR